MDPALCRLLDDLPTSRLFGAFERSHPTDHRLRSLFDLCLRVTVPFAVVDARLQAYLPSAAPSVVADVIHVSDADTLLAAPQNPPTLLTHDGNGDRGRAGADDDTTRDLAPRWVSCCGCPGRACVRSASHRTIHDYWCGGPCPRGWLKCVSSRSALRIVAWHWACLVASTHMPSRFGGLLQEGRRHRDYSSEPPCRGLYEWDFERVLGQTKLYFYSDRVPNTGPWDGVLFKLACENGVLVCAANRGAIVRLQSLTQTSTFSRVPHPSCRQVEVFVSVSPPCADVATTTLTATAEQDASSPRVVAFVDGDPLFAGDIA
ncbi:hypothetical protein pqer_cds_402 [Pandoravirus quercus]|uniref:Uncharacterized protein n=1 Tax=Pandoravirus quercus TaxID=2107709 RepID=A0A2U7U8R2_9VIRU|nr:hypothetical protein pqer_cds_402 [Pandoravirus quercus]AVK74824.1 hypothetical protein pqer_cds_402 [Pandoravirus quercus]